MPASDLEGVLSEHGIDAPADLWRTDLDVLDRITRRLPDDAVRAIEDVTRRWQSTQCRFRKHALPVHHPEPATEEVFA